MNIQQNLTTVNRTVHSNRKIEYIVIHYFGALGTAKNTCAYFKSVNRQASAHYFVDDEIWQAVLDKDASWHCGDSGTGAFKGKCTNANSIGIEVRPHKSNTANVSAADRDWFFGEHTVNNTIELVKTLMDKHGIDADHVIRHYDVTAKWCPRPWMGDDVNTYYGKSGNQLWNEFKAKLAAVPAVNPEIPSDWAQDAIEWARLNGISDGTRPRETATREEIITMLWRACK